MIKVIPMLSRIDDGKYGKVEVVIPASQIEHASTLTLHLPEYGYIIVAGATEAVVMIEKVLEDLGIEFKYEEA